MIRLTLVSTNMISLSVEVSATIFNDANDYHYVVIAEHLLYSC